MEVKQGQPLGSDVLEGGKRGPWRLIGIALLALAVVAVAAVLVNQLRGSTPGIGSPSGKSSAPTQPGTPKPSGDPCPGLGRGPDATTWTTVPRGASSVTLCDGSGGSGLDLVAPKDPLTTKVDELSDLINSGKRLSANAACTAEMGPRYVLVFSYPNGDRVTVSGELYGCRPVGGHVNAAELSTKFLELLTAQRTQLGQPTPRQAMAPGRCDGGSWIQSVPEQTAAATLCVSADTYTSVPVEIVGWSELMQAISPELVSDGLWAQPQAQILASNARGELLGFYAADRQLWWWQGPLRGEQKYYRWRPTDAQWQVIEAAMQASSRPRPPALCTGLENLPAEVDIVGATRIARCLRQPDGSITEHELNEKMTMLVNEAWSRSAIVLTTPEPNPAPGDWLVFADASGARSVMSLDSLGYYRYGPGQTGWQPSDELKEYLDAIPVRR